MDNEKERIVRYVDKNLRSYSWWTKFWSFCHHSFAFGGAIFSAAAALIITTETPVLVPSYVNSAALFSAIAAVIGVISGTGGFQRKWEANRRTKSNLEQVRICLFSDDFDKKAVKLKLKEMIKNHHEGIIGE